MSWESPEKKVAPAPSGKPRIAICIPHTGAWSAEWTDRVYAPLKDIGLDWCEKIHRLCRGVPWPVARNVLAKAALKDPKVTHIFWIDTDVIPEQPPDPNEALRILYSMNEPIVSGFYRARQKHGFNPAMWTKVPTGYVSIVKWTGNWINADAVGFGFCLTKREVFEKIPYPWFTWIEEHPSEDFDFCEKAIKYGYKIKVMTDVKAAHLGTLVVKPDGTIRTPEV